jgi:diacylglycerol kinase (ATP)
MTVALGILNPHSGSADPDGVEEALRRRFSAVEIAMPGEGEDLIGLVRRSIERLRPELVVVSGGDGTLSAVASAAASFGVRLGIVPSGTANVFARELGIPPALEDACDVLVHGTPRRVDAIGYGERRCLCRVAMGLFGEVARATAPEAKKIAGPLAYAVAAVPLIARAELRRFELRIDGVDACHEGSCIVVTNVSEVGGGGLRWSEQVRPDDGQLDVFVVHSQTVPENLGVLWNALTGDAGASRDVTHLTARHEVTILADEALAVVADGEPLRSRELRLRCLAGALEVMSPAAAAPPEGL